MSIYYKFVILLLLTKLCNTEFHNIQIIGGNDAKITDYPYMLDLRVKGSFGLVCGAVLISSKWALTSARCGLAVSGNLDAYLAADSSIEGAGVRIDYINITVHPNFDILTYDNDIAVVALKTPINCKLCKTISLGSFLPKYNETLTILGWGLNDTVGTQSQILQKINLPMANFTRCKEKYITRGYNITENMFCLGDETVLYKSGCVSDEGGPAIFNETLVGIISYGYFCASDFFVYTIVTRIDRYLDWISNITNIS